MMVDPFLLRDQFSGTHQLSTDSTGFAQILPTYRKTDHIEMIHKMADKSICSCLNLGKNVFSGL